MVHLGLPVLLWGYRGDGAYAPPVKDRKKKAPRTPAANTRADYIEERDCPECEQAFLPLPRIKGGTSRQRQCCSPECEAQHRARLW